MGDGLPGWLVLGLAAVVSAGVVVAIVLSDLRPPLPGTLWGVAPGEDTRRSSRLTAARRNRTLLLPVVAAVPRVAVPLGGLLLTGAWGEPVAWLRGPIAGYTLPL